MSEINTRIAEVIRASGLTKTAFAERINVSQPHISRVASGGSAPSDICREFGVNERWLRTGDGEMLMHLSREEEIMRFAATVVRDPSSEFQRRFVSVLARLTPEQWQLMEQMARKLLQEQAADSPQPEESPTDAK